MNESDVLGFNNNNIVFILDLAELLLAVGNILNNSQVYDNKTVYTISINEKTDRIFDV